MTADNLFEGIISRIHAGVHLREEVYGLKTPEEGAAWAARARCWKQEARAWVAAQSPIDAKRLDVLDKLPLLPLLPGNPFYERPATVGITISSTGEGRPGNNPANWHARRVDILQEIERIWRVKPPKGKVGRREIDDSKEEAEATRLMRTEGLSAHQAARRIFPDDASAKRRLYGKLPSKRALKTGTVKRRETV